MLLLRQLQEMIRRLPFHHGIAPELGVELIALSSLYERGRRGVLGHALEAPQRPEFHMIYVGTRGRGRMIVDFAEVPIGAGLVTVVAAHRVQAFVPKPGVDAWMVLFRPEVIGDACSILWPLGPAPALELGRREHAELVAIVDAIAVEQHRAGDRFQPEILASLVRAMVLSIERHVASGKTEDALQRFFTILERDHATTRSVAHYAKSAGLSPRRLGELMHARFGRSPKQIVDERVVLEAKRLLAHSELSVKQLAARLGFAESSNFGKFFRANAGMTPLDFRRNSPSRRRS